MEYQVDLTEVWNLPGEERRYLSERGIQWKKGKRERRIAPQLKRADGNEEQNLDRKTQARLKSLGGSRLEIQHELKERNLYPFYLGQAGTADSAERRPEEERTAKHGGTVQDENDEETDYGRFLGNII